MIVTISKIDFVTIKSVCNADLGRKKAVAWSIRMTFFCCKTNQNGKFASSAFFRKKMKVMLANIMVAQSIKA